MRPLFTLGEAMGLLSPHVKGRLHSGIQLTLGVAGSEMNVAIGAARLGVPTWFAGAVGGDPVGRMVRETLKGQGVVTDLLQEHSDRPTGLMIKEQYGLTDDPRVYYFRRETAMTAWQPPSPLPDALNGGWLHLSGISLMIHPGLRERLMAWIDDWVAARPGHFSFDLNVRRRLGGPEAWRMGVAGALRTASLVFASRHELATLWGTDDTKDLISRGILTPDHTVVVTDGANGAWVERDGSKLASSPAWPVTRVVDAVGAGDGLAAGVLAARLRDWPWEEALRLGSLVGALAVSHPGDWEGYPLWDEAQAALGDSWVDR